jgi:thiosulfate reductase cytochrome b subunit
MARAWHFLSVQGFLLNGFIFVALLFFTDQWKRLVPVSWEIIPAAWNSFVHYATFHLPAEPNGFYQFNPLQQLSYFAVIFVMAPLSMLTGIAMSPAVDNRFPIFPKLFGSRQGARSIHFMLVVGYLARISHDRIEQRSGESVRRLDITQPNDNATRRFFCDRL